MKSKKKLFLGMSALILSGTMVFSTMLPSLQPSEHTSVASSASEKGQVNDITGAVDFDLTQYFRHFERGRRYRPRPL